MGMVSSPQLHYRKSGTAYAITLYTSATDVGSNKFGTRSGGTAYYIPLGLSGDVGATSLHIRKSSQALTNITYRALVGITNPSGSNLLKTAATSAWDNYAISNQIISAGSCTYVTGTIAGTAADILLGLINTMSTPSTTNSYTCANYSIIPIVGSNVYIYELGTLKFTLPCTCAIGDTFTVSIENNLVNYYRNNTKIYTSLIVPSNSYYVYSTAYNQNAGYNNLQYGSDFVALSSVQDPTILASGSTTDLGEYVNAAWGGASAAYYYGSGNNVACTWYSHVAWYEPVDANVHTKFKLNIVPHQSLSDVNHYQVYWGPTTACTAGNATMVSNAYTVDLQANSGPFYFYVSAINGSSAAIFSSPVYGPYTPGHTTYASCNPVQWFYYGPSGGSMNNYLWSSSGRTAGANEALDWNNSSNTLRWYQVGTNNSNIPVPTGAPAQVYSGEYCADACSCNCNYCTCNCNYCTCNCNYTPCSCSSGN